VVSHSVFGGSQNAIIVLAAASGDVSKITPKVLLEPFTGIGVGYKYIKAAKTASERKLRICTLAAFLSTSATSVATADPATNTAVGGAVASKIAYMRAIIARGGASCTNPFDLSSLTVSNPVNPYRYEFASKSKIIIENIFQSRAARRYYQRVNSTGGYLIPLASSSSQLNSSSLILYVLPVVGFGLISFTVIGGFLFLFQGSERKRYLYINNLNDKIFSLVSISADD
jgi:hypothetical protein